jgi:hypothetical protein
MLAEKGLTLVHTEKKTTKKRLLETVYYLKMWVVTLVDPQTNKMPNGYSSGTAAFLGSSVVEETFEPNPDSAKEKGLNCTAYSNWFEKVLTGDFDFLTKVRVLPHNEPIPGGRGFDVRMALASLETRGMTRDQQVKAYITVAQTIVDTVNKDPAFTSGGKSNVPTRVSFDPHRDVFYPCSFQQWLGDNEAFERLQQYGPFDDDFYERKKAFVHAHFTPGMLPRWVAYRIGAPNREVNEVERKEIFRELQERQNSHDNEE